MTPRDLIVAFDTIAEAPNGVALLRKLVLQLAMRGKLVPQNSEDQPAKVLLERIKQEAAAAPNGRVKVEYEVSPPWGNPRGWEWVYLGVAMGLVNGRAFKPAEWTDTGLPIVRIQNLNDPEAPFNRYASEVPERFHIKNDDLLLSWSGTPGTSFGAFIWKRGNALLNQHIFRCLPRGQGYSLEFLQLAINSRLDEMINLAHGGVGLRHITRGKLEGLLLPLPPLAEQKRIVARVDELMALLDQFEGARIARDSTRAALRDSALAALGEADTPDEVELAWARIAKTMHELFTDPADVAPLRQAVLQLAVRGRLVPQDPDDEPASVLLERIAQGNGRLCDAGQIRQPKVVAPVAEDEIPFEVPGGWAWTRFGAITDARLGKMLDKAKNTGPLRPYLRNANVQWFEFVLDELKQLRLERSELAECSVAVGDLIICEGGEPGRAAVCDISAAGMVYQKALHRARPLCGTSPWYLAYLLRCDATSGRLADLFTGATIKHLTGKSLATYTVPLPPLAEQKRIVAKLDELMGLLDRLEQRLTEQSATHDDFAAAAIHHLDT